MCLKIFGLGFLVSESFAVALFWNSVAGLLCRQAQQCCLDNYAFNYLYTHGKFSSIFASKYVFLTLFNVFKAYSLLTYTLAKNISIK